MKDDCKTMTVEKHVDSKETITLSLQPVSDIEADLMESIHRKRILLGSSFSTLTALFVLATFTIGCCCVGLLRTVGASAQSSATAAVEVAVAPAAAADGSRTISCYQNDEEWTIMDPPSREEALNNVARHTVDASEYSCVSWPVICRISPETGSRTQIDSAGLFYDPSNTACAIEDFTDKGTVIMSLGVIETKLCKSVSDAFMGVTCCNTDECNRPQARPADVPLNSKTYTAPTDGKARSCFASNIMDLSDPPIKMDPSTAEIMGYNGCTRYPVFYESSIAYMHWGANVTDCNLNQPLYVKDLCCFEDYCNYPLVF